MKTTRNYGLLLAAQFLGAFGDNAMLSVILGGVMKRFGSGALTAQQQQYENIFYTTLLFVPYVLLAPAAGYLNDRYPKTWGLSGGNLIKVLGALVVAGSVWGGPMWVGVGYGVVGIGACLYSPAKYGILPEIVDSARLVKANGMVELLTLVAILVGNIVGAMLSDRLPPVAAYASVVGIYLASLGLNLWMDRTPAYPEVRWSASLGEFQGNLRSLLSDGRMVRMLFGTALFWICGALMKMNFQPWGQQVLKLGSMTQIALLGLWLSVGIMVGSVLAGRWYRTGELGATRRYGFLLGVGIGLLAAVEVAMRAGLPAPQAWVIGLLALAGVFAGLFLIPLNAAIQAESHQDKLGKTIATQNLLENGAMIVGSVFAWVNVTAKVGPSQLFLSLAVLVVVAAFGLRIPERRSRLEVGAR